MPDLLQSVTYKFQSDTGGLVTGVTGIKSIFSSLTSALGNTKFALQNVGTEGTLASDALKSAAGNMGKALVGVGALASVALIGVGVASTKMAADFQQSMLKNAALAGLQGKAFDDMSNQILALAPQVGQAPKDLADGLYYVLSAGVPASKAIDTVRMSAMLASTGMADMSTTSKGLTTVMKVFGLSTKDAGDIITRTVANGKMTMEQYANSIGKLGLTAQTAHQSVYTTNAALDVLSNNGFPSAAQASTSLSNLFTAMDINTDKLAKTASKLGGTFKSVETSTKTVNGHLEILHKTVTNSVGIGFDETKFKAMSFAQQIDYLNKVTGGNAEEIKKLLGGSKQALQAFQALQQHSAEYSKLLGSVKTATQGAGAAQDAWKTTQQGFNQQMAQLGAALQVVAIKIGQALLPALTKIAQQVTPIILHIADWIEKSHIIENVMGGVRIAIDIVSNVIKTAIDIIKNIITWYTDWHDIINGVAIAITVFFLPAIIKTGVEAVLSGTKLAVSFVANVIKSGVEAVLSAAKLTISFIGAVIKVGIEGAASAAKLVVFIGSLIASGAQAAWAAIKIAVSFVASLISAGIEAMVSAGIFLSTLVPSLLATAAAALAATWPFLLIGLIVAAVVVGIVLAIQHWGEISKWLQGVWQKVADWFSGLWDNIKKLFMNAVNGIKNFFVQNWQLVIGILLGPFGMLIGFVIKFWPQIQEYFKKGMQTLHDILATTGHVLYNIFIQPFVNIWDFISKVFSNIAALFSDVFTLNFAAIPGDLHTLGLPGFAAGGLTPGGPILVGERGPEVIAPPRGYTVYPSPAAFSGGGSGGVTQVDIHLDGQVIARVVAPHLDHAVRTKFGPRGRG